MNYSKILIKKTFFIGSFAILSLSSCQKVIDIKLNDVDKKYVVEGFLNTEANSCNVKISQTVNFSDPNTFPEITDAIVTIQDNDNAPITLSHEGKGIYKNPSIKGESGHIYTLKVTVNGQNFTASSKIPTKVELDSIYVKEVNLFGEKEKYAHIAYTDPKGKGNNYRFILTVNNVVDKQIFSSNDEYIDGNPIKDFLRGRRNDEDEDKEKKKLKSGDIVKVEMQCIDENVYKYWDSIENSQNTAPSNPVSNIKGGALGYFSAHTTQVRTLTVK